MDTRWFRALLDESKITQRHLAKTLGIDPAAVSYLLKGRRRMQMSEAAELSRLLNVPIEEIMLHAGIEVPRATVTNSLEVPIAGVVQATTGEILEAKGKIKRANGAAALPKSAVALRIEGEGPETGWTLFYVPRNQVEATAVGVLAVVTLPGRRGQYLRVLERGSESGTFNLKAWPRGRDLENARILAANPVILIKP